MNNSIELLRERFKRNKKKKRTIPDKKFTDSIFACIGCALDIEKATIKKPLENQNLIYNNLIVNMVSAFEVYLKDVIVQTNRWSEKGYSELLKEKITLSEAYELFNKDKITRQYIVTHYSSFQNLPNINRVFGCLTNSKDFLKEIENHKSHLNPKSDLQSLIEVQPNWRKQLIHIYEIRNRFIHEGFEHKLTLNIVFKFYELFGTIQWVFDEFIGINDFRKK